MRITFTKGGQVKTVRETSAAQIAALKHAGWTTVEVNAKPKKENQNGKKSS